MRFLNACQLSSKSILCGLLLLFTIVSPFDSTSQNCVTQDSSSLIELYNSSSGLSWDLSQEMSSWQGIILNANGCVIRIQLDGLLTEGTIPDALGNIQNLIELDLEDCNLTGPIPLSLGNLINLEELDLEGNNLTGTIPTSLANLSKLSELVLIDNNLSDCYLPQLLPICNITSANDQISNGNNFDGPWSDFCANQNNECSCRYSDSINLIIVYSHLPGAGFNVLNPIDTWEGVTLNENGCVSKIYLDDYLSPGGIIRPEIGYFSELEDLNLNENNIEGIIPATIGNLTKLIELDLDENNLTGPIPASIGNLTQLTRLNLRRNLLTGNIPESIGTLTNLEYLAIDRNQLTGNFPSSFANLINLHTLGLRDNVLEGCYDESLLGLCDILGLDNVYQVSQGNNFDASWPAFCNFEAGACLDCAVADSLALVELFNSSSGLDWNLNSPYPTWQGIITNAEGCVIRIQLDGLMTSGTIPDELGNIEYLVELDLEACNLSGPIPTSLGALINLVELDLEGNNLIGSIPESLSELTQLNELVLIDNNLDGCYSPQLFSLCDISTANNQISDGNNFDGPWFDFCNAQENDCLPCRVQDSLSLLAVFANFDNLNYDFSGPIDSWEGITLNENGCITEIYLDDCCIRDGSLAPEIGNFKELKLLHLKENKIDGPLPSELGNLVNLEYLYLHENNFTGPIPTEMGNLTKLKRLNLADNLLTGDIPSEIGNLTNLNYLSLEENYLTGSIPSAFTNLINIEYISVRSNSMDGCYDGSLMNLCTLLGNTPNFYISYENNFDASWNAFCNLNSGVCYDCAFVDSFALLKLYEATSGLNWNLREPMSTWQGITTNAEGCVIRIQLDGLLTEGTIPQSIGNMQSLIELDLEDCNLTGPISPNIGNLISLEELDLEGNNLTGSIPASIAELPNLNELVLIDNNLSGCYLPELSSLCNISSANNQISDGNNFAGPWFNFCNSTSNECSTCREQDSITLLTVYSNFSISPTIPDGPLDTWFGITLNANGCISEIDLDDCCLRGGNLPAEIGNFSELVYLNLNENNISGAIPPEIGNLANLEELRMDENSFTGSLPSEIGNLSKLRILDLNRNPTLGGDLPSEIGNLINLEYISLGSNQHTGSIPGSFSNLINLQTLSITNNFMEGCFDSSLDILCTTLSSAGINAGNNFDASWSDFCQFGAGTCGLSCKEQDSISLLTILADFASHGIDTSQPLENWSGISLNSDGCVISVDFSDCCVSGGVLAPEIGNLSSLEYLNLDENDIGGPIPTELGNLTNLTYLNLSENAFSGDIPLEIFNLQSLTFLNLGENLLSGIIPTQIGDLELLEYLNLCSNTLYGPIPIEIGNLSQLKQLYLLDNNLSGSIPAELGNLSQLVELLVRSNNLSGCYDPNLIKLCPNLLYDNNVNISYENNFDAEWEDFCSSGAGVCGPTCTFTDSLSLLTVINNLENSIDVSGPIADWQGITLNADGCVTEIDFDDCCHSGGILAPEIGNLASLERLFLTERGINGPLPPEIGNLTNLVALGLWQNNFTGNIPVEFANLSNLTYIDIGANLLSGCYDQELIALCSVSTAYISGLNNFDASWEDFCASGAGACCVDDLNISGTINANQFSAANNTIISDAQIISGSIQFNAGQCLTLEPNFEVSLGAVFIAEIEACQ